MLGERELVERGVGARLVVFGALARFAQRPVAAGDEAHHLARVTMEGRRALTGVQHAQAAAGAGADVDQPAAFPHAFDCLFDELGELGQRGADSARHFQVLGVHQRQGLVDVQRVDGGGRGQPLLGFELGAVDHGGGTRSGAVEPIALIGGRAQRTKARGADNEGAP